MPYNGNIPQATDLLSSSQPLIQGNFSAIQTLIDVDHVDFASANQGKHFRVSLPVQSGPSFDATDTGLYSALNPNSSQNEIYAYHYNSTGTLRTPMTASVLGTNADPGSNSAGWSYLPSGILLKWGSATVTSTSGSPVQTVTLPTGASIPAFSRIFSVLLTVSTSTSADNNNFVILQNISGIGTSFNVIAVARSSTLTTYVQATFQYLCIGI
jgi:hypothetical protein